MMLAKQFAYNHVMMLKHSREYVNKIKVAFLALHMNNKNYNYIMPQIYKNIKSNYAFLREKYEECECGEMMDLRIWARKTSVSRTDNRPAYPAGG